MIRLIRRLDATEEKPSSISGILALTYDERKRGRLRTQTTDGRLAGLFLERGKALCEGDILQAEDGTFYGIQAAPEAVVEAHTTDWLAFAKVCYHLGNRHLPLQIDALSLRFQPDHVLEELVQLHGLETCQAELPFQPESGAYGSHGGHRHGQGEDDLHDTRLRPQTPIQGSGLLGVMSLEP